MTVRCNTIRTLIEYVLSENHWHGGWLSTKTIAKRINQLSPINAPGHGAKDREVREKLQTLWRDGRVHRTRDGRGYSWRWKP